MPDVEQLPEQSRDVDARQFLNCRPAGADFCGQETDKQKTQVGQAGRRQRLLVDGGRDDGAGLAGADSPEEQYLRTYHRFYDSCRVLPRGDEEVGDLHRARLVLPDRGRVGAGRAGVGPRRQLVRAGHADCQIR